MTQLQPSKARNARVLRSLLTPRAGPGTRVVASRAVPSPESANACGGGTTIARLYDRILAKGCRPLSAGDLHREALRDVETRAAFAEELRERGELVTEEAIDGLMRAAQASARGARASEVLDPDRLVSARVITADDVGHYFAEFPDGTRLTDVVSSIAPPFEQFFVEFHGVSIALGMRAWGVLFEQLQGPEEPDPDHPDDAWLLKATIVGEWDKHQPVGPIATYLLPLGTTGELHAGDEDGHGSLFGGLVDIEGMPVEEQEQWRGNFNRLLGAAMLAVSFMHCKNVDVIEVTPPAALSRKHQRHHGRPLARYYVLEIAAMRGAMNADGAAREQGLRQALHICRGHFKTFSPDAPLFGRLSGTYWWASHVRGDEAEGRVEKDYRVVVDRGEWGRAYRQVDEHPELRRAEEGQGDPDLSGRGLGAHNATQNALAEAVAAAGYEPRSPRPEEPQFDLAWESRDAVWVAEVKSLAPAAEERQLRLAIGQVLRYRQLLDAGERPVHAVIAVERQPSDQSWLALCAEQGIALTWPESFAGAL
jgi:hypothetical protein